MATFLAVFGLVLVVVGVCLWSVPAGFVAAGVACVLTAFGAVLSEDRGK